MAFSQIRSQKQHTPFQLKKILRKGEAFVCGLCKREYLRRQDAAVCLKKCTINFIKTTTIREKRNGKATTYECGFCCREYESPDLASGCANSCRNKAKQLVIREQKVLQQKRKLKRELPPPLPGTPPAHALAAESKKKVANSNVLDLDPRRSEARAKPVPPIKKTQDDIEIINLDLGTQGADENWGQVDQEPAAPRRDRLTQNSPPEADADQDLDGDELEDESDERSPRINRRDQMYKYGRDGRILFCKKCGKEFKTIDAVIGCYDSHVGDVKPEGRAISSKNKSYGFESELFLCAKCKTPHSSKKKSLECCQTFGQDADDKDIVKIDVRKDSEKFSRAGSKYVCNKCGVKHFTKDAVVDCYNGHPEDFVRPVAEHEPPEDIQEEAPQPPVEAPAEEDLESMWADAGLPTQKAPAEPEVPLEGDGKFRRAGSKYVCAKCDAKYFTRTEVINCFESHES